MTLYRRLLPLAALLALGVITLGAWVRLSDAGLGCPDWPGCYGHWLGVPEQALDPGRAGKEMIHRYVAASLGLILFVLCLLAWRQKPKTSPALPTVLAGLVVGQALLGMWTVTLRLKPLVVSAHLLGGMVLLALLVWLNLRERAVNKTARNESAGALPPADRPQIVVLTYTGPGTPSEIRMDTGSTGHAPGPGRAGPSLKAAGLGILALVFFQIALGGWVSGNYAALACPDFPTCQGAWLPAMDFSRAFSLDRELGRAADGALLSGAALTAMHWSHRIGALAVVLAAGGLGLALVRRPGWSGWGGLLLGLIALQAGLGIANVLLALPLPLAVAHNAGAALLLAATVAINFRLWRAPNSALGGRIGEPPARRTGDRRVVNSRPD